MYNTQTLGMPGVRHLDRSSFVRKVYFHLLISILSFVGFEYAWFSTPIAFNILKITVGVHWLVILGVFIGMAWLATHLTSSLNSKTTQYAGLGLYVLAESLIFVPMLYYAQAYAGPGVIERSAYFTVGAFGALTAVVFLTKVDLIGWGKYLMWAGILALGAVILGAIFNYDLGTYFSVAMVGLAGAAILHDTSRILLHYDDRSYVYASLQLFASIALMFWYILDLERRR